MKNYMTPEETADAARILIYNPQAYDGRGLVPCPDCGAPVMLGYLEERHYIVQCIACRSVVLYDASSWAEARARWNRRADRTMPTEKI